MINAVLVGNPNTGKTTLYNTLTSSHEHVGNWHGVTVEEKAKVYSYNDQKIKLVDLPGIYSLSALSYEEQVSIDYIIQNHEDVFINICDENALEKNLYLTLSLMEYSCHVILVVNRTNKRPLAKVNFSVLEKTLGLKVLVVDARDKESCKRINDEILAVYSDIKEGEKVKYILPYLKQIDVSKIDYALKARKIDDLFFKLKLLENDENIKKKLKINENFDGFERIIELRYKYIDEIISKTSSKKTRIQGKSKADKILLNKYLALPIFLCCMCGVFYLTFFSLGQFLTEKFEFVLCKFFQTPIVNFIAKVFDENSWITGFFDKAIMGGLAAVISFLPQVVLLFFFLSLLEDSGYLSRVAFVFDDILSKVGLSGKSVYTLLMGFGCSTTAVLTARTMDDKNSKIKTSLLSPYMSCSAKFPIYAAIGSVFFGERNIFVIMGLYFLGLIVAIVISSIFERTVLKSQEQSFILEMPSYKMVSAKKILFNLVKNTKEFVLRVGSGILAMNVIVFILGNFSFTFRYLPSGEGTILECFGKVLAPLFVPLGFGKWEIVSALASGVVAKEVVLSSLLIFSGDSGLMSLFSGKGAVLSFLVFTLLYCPCLSTALVLKQEIGRKWTTIGVCVQFIVAYITSMLFYSIAVMIEKFTVLKVTILIVIVISVILAVLYIKRLIRRKKCPMGMRCFKRCKNK